MKTSMKNLASFILPSILGLIAGIGHGITSHHQELPFSLADQVIESVQNPHFFQLVSTVDRLRLLGSFLKI